jgi:HSP20 family protein
MAGKKEKPIALRPFFKLPSSFEEFFSGMEFPQKTGLSVSEDHDHVYIDADLPGLKAEDIELHFENGILWIKGERKEEEQDKKKKYYRRASSSFSYRVNVPGPIDEKKEPDASYRDGVLRVSFAKSRKAPAKKIPVKSKK